MQPTLETSHQTVDNKCDCGMEAEFRVIPIGLKHRSEGGLTGDRGGWAKCSRHLIQTLRAECYNSYTVRMID